MNESLFWVRYFLWIMWVNDSVTNCTDMVNEFNSIDKREFLKNVVAFLFNKMKVNEKSPVKHQKK